MAKKIKTVEEKRRDKLNMLKSELSSLKHVKLSKKGDEERIKILEHKIKYTENGECYLPHNCNGCFDDCTFRT